MERERCLICGAEVPEGQQVCPECIMRYGMEAGQNTEAAKELRDIADVLKITANTDGNIKQSMEALLRIADRLTGGKRNGKEDGKTGI